MPIKGLNQVALPQAKAILERLKFNVVSAARMWARLFRALVFSFNPHICKYLAHLHGGALTVTTVCLIVQKGQCFFVLVFQ